MRTTIDTYEMHVNYGQGWEHELTEYSFWAKCDRSREYRADCVYSWKWKSKRVKIDSLKPGELATIHEQIKSDHVYYKEAKTKRDAKREQQKQEAFNRCLEAEIRKAERRRIIQAERELHLFTTWGVQPI